MNFEEQNNNEQESIEEMSEAVCEEQLPIDAEVIEESHQEVPTEEITLEMPATEREDKKKAKKKKTWKQELLEWIYCLGIALLVSFLLITFVGQIVRVDGRSMEPTLQNNQQLILYKLGYTPKKGDIIVFESRGGRGKFIKRVIGTPGDTVDLRPDGMGTFDVYVNDEKLEEDYISEKIKLRFNGTVWDYDGPQTVPEGHVFVLGDNRNASDDSRDEQNVGMVTYDSILGKAIFRIWPLNKIGTVH